MTDKKGSYYNNGSYNIYRACIRYETTATTDTSVTIRCRSWCQMGEGHDSSSNIQGRAYITDTYSSWVAGDGTYLNAGDESNFLGDITKTIQKTEQAQTITCSGQVWGSTWDAYSPWVNANVTVPALQSWNVTYNANGGSGAPSAQKKYYGKALKLSSATPTRSGYTFQGWATSSGGSVAYKAGASYTGDAALSLYAVWRANAAAPTISKFVAYRSSADGTRDDSSTSHVTFNLSWTMDSGASSRSVVFTYKIDNGSGVTKTVSSPAVSGSAKQTYAVTLAGTSRMTVTATVTDSTHKLTATRTVTISLVFKPFHMANKGYAAAFFGLAGASWNKILKIFGSLFIEADNAELNFQSTVSTTKIGTNVPESNVVLQSERVYDSDGTNIYYSQAVRNSSDHLYKSYVLRRLNAAGTAITGGFYTYLTKDGESTLSFTGTNTKKNWHKVISGWTSIATASGTTAKTFSDVNTAGYSELLVVCKYSTTYRSSVVVPVAELDTTDRWWYLGGGWWSTGYGAACKLTRTKITPDKIMVGSSAVNADWTVYAR